MLCSQSGIADIKIPALLEGAGCCAPSQELLSAGMGGGRALGKSDGSKIRWAVDGDSSQRLALLAEGKV